MFDSNGSLASLLVQNADNIFNTNNMIKFKNLGNLPGSKTNMYLMTSQIPLVNAILVFWPSWKNKQSPRFKVTKPLNFTA